tara:strand:+ start:3798 stop:4352 length:555 start_codon:yes stop_codon:yes gene_type:complete
MNSVINIESFNFKEALLKTINDNSNKDNVCLISHEPIPDYNLITLSCGHSFNYDILIKSLEKNKWTKIHIINKIKGFNCPYCRKHHSTILPRIPELFSKKIYGINYDNESSVITNKCSHILNSGRRCNKCCLNKLCKTHYLKITDMKFKTLPELKKLAKSMKLKRYSKLRKDELIKLIEENKNI